MILNLQSVALNPTGQTFVKSTKAVNDVVRITGTQTITADNNFTSSTPQDGDFLVFFYDAKASYSGGVVNILGYALTQTQATANLIVIGRYTTAWQVSVVPVNNQNEYIERVRLVDAIINADKLDTDAVTTAKILDEAVTTAKIDDEAVTNAKLATDSVTAVKIDDGAVIESKIDDGAVTVNKLGDLAISTAKIANDAVTTAKIDDDAVTTAKIVDDAVTLPKLASTGQVSDQFSISGVANGTTDEEVLLSKSIQDQLKVNGNSITLEARGVCAANADSKAIRIRIGGITGTTVAQNTVTTAPNGLAFLIRVTIQRTDATSGQCFTEVVFNGVATQLSRQTVTATWANAIDFVLTADGTNVADVTAYSLTARVDR